MTDEDKLEGMWHQNDAVKIMTSEDGGQTCVNRLIIADKPAAWAGLVLMRVICWLSVRNELVRAQLVALG